jgi:uncharacterized protein (TIGR02996 family)
MPRYEKAGPKATEYIDLHLDGVKMRTETGKIGGKPKIKEVAHKSEYAAESRMTRAIAAAKAKGFAHVSTLRATAENAEMQAAIAKTPDDDALRVAYGEWLVERGDPRGELFGVQRQIAGAKEAELPALRRHERAVLGAHSSLLYGTLDELLHVTGDRPVVRVEWKLAFFDEVELRLSEGGMPQFPKLSEAVRVLAGLPSARLLRRLVLGGSASDYRPALKEALALPRTLRSLRVTGQLWGEYTPREHRIGDLAPLCRAHPQLEELAMKIGKEPLEGIAHPNLVTLDLWTNQLGPRAIESLTRASWPRLRTLGVAIGTSASVKPDDFDALLTPKTLPALRTLKLGVVPDVAFANALMPHVAKLKLDSLVLVNTDEDVAAAIRSATRVPVSTQERET